MSERAPATGHEVSFGEAARFWIKLGFINFGGPAGQIAVMHEELVERRGWIGEARFLHALSYCTLLPGPEAQQLAIYVGWLLHKVRGGIVAGIAFILPGFLLIGALSWVYAVHGTVPAIQGVFAGLQAAVVGIVAAAMIRIASRALGNGRRFAVAVAAFLALLLGHVAFPILILVAGLVGATGILGTTGRGADGDIDEAPLPAHAQPSVGRALRALLVGLVVWIVPLAIVVNAPWAPEVLGQEAVFFSKAAMVTFGGAYAVLAYMNAAAISFGWLAPGQMATGLGLAESTPGPLIMVTEFVGFLAAYQHPGTLSPLAAGALGATVTTWATFAPCFLWIFLGAPYVEVLRKGPRLRGALSAVTAAVVGVIANLAVVFGVHTLFERTRDVIVLGGPVNIPVLSSVDVVAVLIAVGAFVAMWRYRVHVLWVVGAAAVIGVARAII
jgi:chromate transporter